MEKTQAQLDWKNNLGVQQFFNQVIVQFKSGAILTYSKYSLV